MQVEGGGVPGPGRHLSPWGSRAHVYARPNRRGAVICAGLCARVRALQATRRAPLVQHTRAFMRACAFIVRA